MDGDSNANTDTNTDLLNEVEATIRHLKWLMEHAQDSEHAQDNIEP